MTGLIRSSRPTAVQVRLSPQGEGASVAKMEELLDQQAELLKVGEDLLRRSSDAMREAVGPDALRKGYEVWMGGRRDSSLREV